MAALATQKVALPAIVPAFTAAAGGGDTASAGDQSFLVVKNGGGAPITVTLVCVPDVTEWGAAIPDLIISVTNATEKWIGPLRGSIFGSTVAISYSAVTSVTVGVVST